MNDATTLTCICGTDHTFPAGVATGTCSGCGLGLVLTEESAAEDAMIPDADALAIPGALVAKVGLLLDRGAREAAIDLVSRAMEAAREAGREEAREEFAADRDGDPAEDCEPDISDEGFDPYLNTYTDDC